MTLPTPRFKLGGTVLLFLPILLHAQLSRNAIGGSFLAQAPAQPGTVRSAQQGTIQGTVRDVHGIAVPRVQVVLVLPDGEGTRVATSDESGSFAFADLTPGTYQVKVNGPVIGPAGSVTVALAEAQRTDVTLVASGLPKQTTTVEVNATVEQIAEAQVHLEEQQRVLGFFPSYYTSYLWDASPLTPKLKYRLALRTLTDPVTFLGSAMTAGVEQWRHTFPGYGLGAQGYGKRFGATYADTVSNRMLGSAVFPALFHQDPRYFYQGSGTVRSRMLYALISTVICRGDNGQLEPNYSHVLGSFAAAGLSNVYRAPQDRQASLTIRNGFIIIGSSAVVNVLREFLSKKLTPNVPSFANGKPAALPAKTP